MKKIDLFATWRVKKKSALEALGHVAERFNFVQQLLTADDLEKIFSNLTVNRVSWEDCDTILCCPLTYQGVAYLFPSHRIISVPDAAGAIKELVKVEAGVFGVASPQLSDQLCADAVALHLLHRKSQNELLLSCDFLSHSRSEMIRKALHKLGFYEVSQLSQNDPEYVSIGVLPGGESVVYGANYFLGSCETRWGTLRASKLPVTDTSGFEWESLTVDPFINDGRISAPANGATSFVVRQSYRDTQESCSTVEATFVWAEQGDGDASLIGAYSGPGQQNMYLCHVQLVGLDSVSVSLWVNVEGEDKLLNQPQTVSVASLEPGSSEREINIKMVVGPTKIAILVDGEVILKVENSDIRRSPRLGLRARGAAPAVKSLSVDDVTDL